MSLYQQLFDYQKNIVDKYRFRDRFGLYLDMGLGKTILSLAFTEVNKCSRIIIVTINSKVNESPDLKGSWLNWVNQSDLDYTLYQKDKLIRKKSNNKCIIINYEGLFKRSNSKCKVELRDYIKNFIEECKDEKVALIVDESHKMKNTGSLQTEALFKIQKDLLSKSSQLYCYLLTGTPFTNTFVDLYSQLRFLGYNQIKSSFIEEYCIRGEIKGLLGWQQPVIGYKNLDDLFKLVHNYAITNKSEEFLKLPDQKFNYIPLKSSEYFNLYTNEKYLDSKIELEFKNRGLHFDNKVKNTKINNPFYRNIDYPSDKYLTDTIGTFWLRSRQLNIGFIGNSEECIWYNRDRLYKLKDIIKKDPGNYVVFYNYTPELYMIFNVFEELSYNIDIYCGDIKSLENHKNFNESQKNNNVIISNYTSGSTGMNWQEYHKCVLFSLPLYKDYEQCLKRIHRTGQKNEVTYYILYSDNWLDKDMLKSLNEKKQYNIRLFENSLEEQMKL